MKNSKVSIILPVYNGEKFISDSVNSILNQTHTDWELIIVNDCSTDGTLGIISEFALIDSRILVINNDENKKLPASLNIGHKVANGMFLTWTSHDNIYEVNAIEELLKPIFAGEADIVYSDISLIDNDNNFKKEILLPEVETLIFGNCIGASFMYKREVYERNEGYNENLFLVEDYDFWIRAFKHSKFIHLKKSLYKYRTHENSLTSEIKFNKDKQNLWKKNCKTMYTSFFASYIDNYKAITDIFTSKLTKTHIDFSIVIKENKNFTLLKNKLKQNSNINKSTTIEKTFLKEMIRIMVDNQDKKNNFFKCMFIIKNYMFALDKNSFKTLLKYSFFK